MGDGGPAPEQSRRSPREALNLLAQEDPLDGLLRPRHGGSEAFLFGGGGGVPEAQPAEEHELRRLLREREAEAEALRLRICGMRRNLVSPSGGRALSVIIPMIGLGEAFAEAGYRLPKPLVNVVGRPVLLWLLDHLGLMPRDLVYLAVPSTVERQHGVAKLVSQEYPMLNVQVVALPFETRGWVETVFSVVRRMPALHLKMHLVVLDCSTIYPGVNILEKIRGLPEGTGASVYFDIESAGALKKQGSVPAQFSYVQLDSEGFITAVAEKHVISSLANAGAYIFRSARDFRTSAEQMLESHEDSDNGGLYASSLMSAMLKEKHRFLGLRVDTTQFEIVSTPPQLQTFVRRVCTGEVRMDRKMRFCFDLDGTLVTEPRVPEDLSTCEPILNSIALVRQLHAAGHTIIIVTARGMNLRRGVDTAVAEVGRATFATLTQLGIPYHELHFGKPCADVYVDSRMLNVEANVERDLGWSVGSEVPGGRDLVDGAVEARAFNIVRAKGKAHVIKSSSPEVLRGECHWYRSIPQPLAQFFPAPLDIIEDDVVGDATISTITMAKVSGITFSHLVTTRLLTKAWLHRLVHALHQIHSQDPHAESALAKEPKVTSQEMCANYAGKVRKRVAKHGSLYRSLGEELGMDTARMATVVTGFLEEFEATERAKHAYYIHGDPVFSNVMRTADDRIVLIDMRGELGARLTTQGDVHYDLSKVFQSLCGYDFMLLDQVLDETSSEIFDGLRAAFWEELRRLYPDVSHRDVRLHTASHFFAIVPLHEVRSRMARYLRTSFSMLSVEGLM